MTEEIENFTTRFLSFVLRPWFRFTDWRWERDWGSEKRMQKTLNIHTDYCWNLSRADGGPCVCDDEVHDGTV